MNTIFRKIRQNERDIFLNMTRKFHSPPAVLHIPDEKILVRNFEEAVGNSRFFIGYIFETDGEISGYSLLSPKFETEVGGIALWIEELYVEEKFRGCGIGTEFLDFIKSEYGGEIKRIRLEVGDENDGAKRLYERNGFDFLDYRQMTIDYK